MLVMHKLMGGFVAILEQLLQHMESQSDSDSESSTHSDLGTTAKLYSLFHSLQENLETPFSKVVTELKELHGLHAANRALVRAKTRSGSHKKSRYKVMVEQLEAAMEKKDHDLICGVLRVAHSRIPFDKSKRRWVEFSQLLIKFLIDLIFAGETSKLQEILEIGFVDVIDPSTGRYLIHFASESGNLNCLQTVAKMLQTSPNVTSNTISGNTPLHLAVSQGHTECAQYLIKLSADVDAQDNKGQTPLLKATRGAFYDCIQLLLTNGANPDIVNNMGESPLSVAAGFVQAFNPKKDANFRCVILLLCNNANLPLHIDRHSRNVIRSAARVLLSSYWTSVIINPKITHHLQNLLDTSSPSTTDASLGRSDSDISMMEDDFSV
uniref:Uncharacterized protein n=1 Tax=Vannella robusta TaxID=1487602 RepID=A0A7S4MKC7_9EUKA|mmetsp:Transcript_24895/g.31684  ORF Transcript_24895/g.31684 Transcript_24895/m.31684 type:complete len:380 (+) Transcript_24895:154-1293(+)